MLALDLHPTMNDGRHCNRSATCRREERAVSKDPVCAMQLSEASAPAKTEYKGKTYYFCSQACKMTFERNPEKYASQ